MQISEFMYCWGLRGGQECATNGTCSLYHVRTDMVYSCDLCDVVEYVCVPFPVLLKCVNRLELMVLIASCISVLSTVDSRRSCITGSSFPATSSRCAFRPLAVLCLQPPPELAMSPWMYRKLGCRSRSSRLLCLSLLRWTMRPGICRPGVLRNGRRQCRYRSRFLLRFYLWLLCSF